MSERIEPLSRVSGDASTGPRQCGPCTACCTVMSVREIGNAAGVRCPNERENCCAIYQNRPDGCRGFTCLWLADGKGLLQPEHRPDRIGLVLTDDADGDDSGQAIAARECWAGAASQPQAAQLLAFLRQFVTVRVLPAAPPSPALLTLEGHEIRADLPLGDVDLIRSAAA